MDPDTDKDNDMDRTWTGTRTPGVDSDTRLSRKQMLSRHRNYELSHKYWWKCIKTTKIGEARPTTSRALLISSPTLAFLNSIDQKWIYAEQKMMVE